MTALNTSIAHWEHSGGNQPVVIVRFNRSRQRSIATDVTQSDPKAGGFTLLMEMNALAFNPRMHLFSSGTAHQLIVESGNQVALDELERLLSQTRWAVYQVQRIYKQLTGKNGKPYVNADRKVVLIHEGTQAEMERHLQAIAQQHNAVVEDLYGKRVYIHRRQEGTYPAFEEFYVVAPKLANNKCRNLKAFNRFWSELTGSPRPVQLDLFVS